jgi:hypothetical protein
MRDRAGIGFWSVWTVAATGGLVLGYLSDAVPQAMLMYLVRERPGFLDAMGVFRLPVMAVLPLLGGTVYGLVAGGLQAFVLRRSWWLPATVIGLLGALVLGRFVLIRWLDPLDPLFRLSSVFLPLSGVVPALAAACLQSLVLRRLVPHAWLWILGAFLAAGIAQWASFHSAELMYRFLIYSPLSRIAILHEFLPGPLPAATILARGLDAFVAGLMYGGLMGLLMLRLLRAGEGAERGTAG